MQTLSGRPYPLGATYDGQGVNFAVFTGVADKVELCLFEPGGRERRIVLPERTGPVWHGYLQGCSVGQAYGYRVHGPWEPQDGLRCNPNFLLMDPYAKAIEGLPTWDESLFTCREADDKVDRFNETDTARFMPRSIVVDGLFDWSGDFRPDTPLYKTVIYEAHVKAFTMRCPGVPQELRGTYAGLAHPVAIEYLRELGVTALELLPVHQFVHDDALLKRGLRQFWGYNTLGYFAPHNEYASRGQRGQQVAEFKAMVKALHAAGIEVILDVVYNHTAEGDYCGPTLSFRGFDNPAYYRLQSDNRRFYSDYTGTGNTLNAANPHVLQLIMDSLRYWVTEMHVDGFRFDLAATLARELHDVDRLGSFFDTIHQDPVLNRVKLIAEPWDVGEGGYQLGNFPPQWSEWNDRYRDTMRDFWRGTNQTLAEFANRFTGSSDLYENSGRRPYASVNFITAHDGFTLRDLVSYNEKQNHANGEDNRDGHNDNRSWNCGHEGATRDRKIIALRQRMQRNFLATLLLSQGVPMIRSGDELAQTKGGNNNTYCHDSKLTWLDWKADDQGLLRFTRRLIALRRRERVFRRRHWFQGQAIHGRENPEIQWYRPDGAVMNGEDWSAGFAKCLLVLLDGGAADHVDEYGERVRGDRFCLLFNAADHPMKFRLPECRGARAWIKIIDTNDPDVQEREQRYELTGEVELNDHAMMVLRDERETDG
jgi:isoamylase